MQYIKRRYAAYQGMKEKVIGMIGWRYLIYLIQIDQIIYKGVNLL